MIRFSKRVEYALLLLSYLSKREGEIVSLDQIARQKKLPLPFLSHIAVDLKKAGYIFSKEGKGGGYSLAPNLDKRNLLDVLESVEEPKSLISCSDGSRCLHEQHCGLKGPLNILDEKLKAVFGSIFLGDLFAESLLSHE